MIAYLQLMWIYFKIGLFTIGGGYAMLPLINSELVAAGLMTPVEAADILAVSQITPGPFAVNAATFSGVKTLGILGGVTTTLAVALPSLLITTLLAKYFFHFEDNIIVRRAMWGLRPAVTGLIAAAAVIMGSACAVRRPNAGHALVAVAASRRRYRIRRHRPRSRRGRHQIQSVAHSRRHRGGYHRPRLIWGTRAVVLSICACILKNHQPFQNRFFHIP